MSKGSFTKAYSIAVRATTARRRSVYASLFALILSTLRGRGIREADCPFVRPGPPGTSGTAHPQARREPALLRERDGHDRERPARRLRLPARLGRLRASHAQADR